MQIFLIDKEILIHDIPGADDSEFAQKIEPVLK